MAMPAISLLRQRILLLTCLRSNDVVNEACFLARLGRTTTWKAQSKAPRPVNNKYAPLKHSG
jgi:hypothetical protein